MSQEKRILPEDLRLLGRRPWPFSPPTKAELAYWNQLFNIAFPSHEPDPCLMDIDYITAYIAWLERDGSENITQENALLAAYQTWLNYLNGKKERERLYYAAWRTTWDEGFARRAPLHELYKMASLAGRMAQREFDYPDQPKTGADPSLDTLRERYEYYSYSRIEVRAAVEKELGQLRINLAELRSIGGDKFNREVLPNLTKAIDAFLAAKPALESLVLTDTGQPRRQVKESTRLLAIILFVDKAKHIAKHIFEVLASLKETLRDETTYLEELGWRLNELVHTSTEGQEIFVQESETDHWQRDYNGFEKSKSQAFDLIRLAWEKLAEFTGVELAFHPAYTSTSTFFEVIHYQQKTTNNLRIVAFCWAWHTYLKTADLEAARKTFGKLLPPFEE